MHFCGNREVHSHGNTSAVKKRALSLQPHGARTRTLEGEDFRFLLRERVDLCSNNGSHRMPPEVVSCRARPSSLGWILPRDYLVFVLCPLSRERLYLQCMDRGRHEVTSGGFLAFFIDLNGVRLNIARRNDWPNISASNQSKSYFKITAQ